MRPSVLLPVPSQFQHQSTHSPGNVMRSKCWSLKLATTLARLQAHGPLWLSRWRPCSELISPGTVRRQQFVPFGTVKSVINAAKAGFPPNKEIRVRHAPQQPKTAATGAEVPAQAAFTLPAVAVQSQSHRIMPRNVPCIARLEPLPRRAGARTPSKLHPPTPSWKKSRSHAQRGCAVVCGCCGVGDFAAWFVISTS